MRFHTIIKILAFVSCFCYFLYSSTSCNKMKIYGANKYCLTFLIQIYFRCRSKNIKQIVFEIETIVLLLKSRLRPAKYDYVMVLFVCPLTFAFPDDNYTSFVPIDINICFWEALKARMISIDFEVTSPKVTNQIVQNPCTHNSYCLLWKLSMRG